LSPAGSQGSQTNNRYRYSPQNATGSLNKNKFGGGTQQQSPGARSNASNGSKNSTGSNRLYSPSGRVRGTTGLYGSKPAGLTQNGAGTSSSGQMGVNRVRREPAVVGSTLANSRSNSRGGQSPINSVTKSPSMGGNSMRKTNYSN